MALPEQDVSRPATSFADLQIHPAVLQAVDDVGYESPSAVQAATIPAMMAGSDVVGLAQTGTGKTAAFAMPILSKIDTASTDTQALVLAPTRELALQVAEAFRRYGAHLPRINVLPIYGGQSYGVQLAGLKRGAHVVVGTPGRVIDHLERGALDLSRLDYLVLDEADEMLQMGFAEDVERILSNTPEYKQVALFSATMPPAIRKITKKHLTDAVARRLDVERISHVLNYDTPHDTESYVHRIGRTGRAGRSGQALLFVSPRERHMLKSIEKATRQTLTEVQLPSVEDVNAQRVAKFADSITRSE